MAVFLLSVELGNHFQISTLSIFKLNKMDILEKLRAETRADHDELEAIGLSEKIMNGTLTPDEYKKLVRVHYLVHRSLEKQLEKQNVQQYFPELRYEERKKLPLIRKDIAELGMDETDLQRESPAGDLPDPEVPYGLLGTMYVMEGATLGGMVIVKSLRKNDHLKEIDTFHYFGCYGGETGTQWKQFLEVLKLEGNKPEAREQVVSAAKQTYQFFRSNFQKFL